MSYDLMVGYHTKAIFDNKERNVISFVENRVTELISINMSSGNLAKLLQIIDVEAFDDKGNVTEPLEGYRLKTAFEKLCEITGRNPETARVEDYEKYYSDQFDDYTQQRLEQLALLMAYAITFDQLIYWA